MVPASELYCVVRGNIGDDIVVQREPRKWIAFRWLDDFGNSIAPFFTSLEHGRQFLKETTGWQLKGKPTFVVVQAILAAMSEETAFYTIDPVSTEQFKALTPVEFLTQLIYRTYRVEVETQDLVLERQDIIPIEVLLGAGRDHDADDEYRHLLSIADLIFGVDVKAGTQSLVFGRMSLEELARTGQSKILGVVNIGFDQETMDIEQLASLVRDIKGHHDYYGARIR